LTKGIGHKEFKNTKIGKIPKEWEVTVVEKICRKVTDGTHDTPKPAKTGYYLITSKNIKNGEIDFSNAYLINDSDFHEVNKRSRVDSYDVLFGMIGTVGQTTVVTEDYPQFAIKNVGLFKTNKNKWLALWLHYYFCSEFAQKYINSNVKGTTQKYMPLFSLRNFPIMVPSHSEQQKIAEILSTVDKKLELLRKRKGRIERMKNSLMNELLTGKKRVKV
jgi:type I restriction enzyme S subunit